MMTAQQYLRCLPYRNILFNNNALSNEAKLIFYDVYNQMYNDTKKPNSCSACLRSVLDRVRINFKNFEEQNDSGKLDFRELP